MDLTPELVRQLMDDPEIPQDVLLEVLVGIRGTPETRHDTAQELLLDRTATRSKEEQ